MEELSTQIKKKVSNADLPGLLRGMICIFVHLIYTSLCTGQFKFQEARTESHT